MVSYSYFVRCAGVSAVTAWLTLLRRGTVRMTTPTVIFLGPDGGSHVRARMDEKPIPTKVYLRTLLYANAKQGRIVESIFVRLRRSETSQTFNIWAYGEARLERGSGLFVNDTGVTYNHHFLLPEDGTRFPLLAGTYTLDVYATLVGSAQALELFTTQLDITHEQAEELKAPHTGIYYDWRPESRSYHAHIMREPSFQLSD